MTATARTINSTAAQVKEIVCRLLVVGEWPEFLREHYELHC